MDHEHATVSEEHGCRSRAEAIGLLDFEIGRIQRQIRASGWTSWGLLVALSGVAWTLFDLITRPDFDYARLAQYIVALFCGREVLTTLVRLLDSSPGHFADTPRFHWSSTVLEGQKLGAGLQLFEAVVIAVLAVMFRGTVAYVGTIAAVVLAVLLILGNLSLFALIHPDTALPIPLTGKAPRWARITRFIAPATALAAAATFLHSVGLSAPEAAKAAGLVLAVFILAEQMAQERAGHPLLGPLIELRRDVALSRVRIEEALRRMEVLLEGEELEQLLQDDIAKVMRVVDTLAKLDERIHEAAAALADSDLFTRPVEDVRTELDGLLRLVQESEKLEAELSQRVGGLTKKQQRVSYVLNVFGIAATDSRILSLLQAQLDIIERGRSLQEAAAKAREAAEARLSEGTPSRP